MVEITEKQKSDFNTLGIVLVEDVIPPQQLSAMKAQLEDLWTQAKKKEIGAIRVYDDFPYFLGGVNVAAIENPFVYAPILSDWLTTSGVDQILKNLTGWSGAKLELARIHMNDRFKYQGFWHRDATVNQVNSSVVAIAYFRSETGFRIAAANNQFSAPNLSLGDDIQRQYSYDPIEGERTITAPAGSLFFMKSYLLHRGYNNKPRLHMHMRFVEADSYDVDSWREYRNTAIRDYNFTTSSPVARARTLVSYCIPRQSRSSLFQK